MCSENNVSLRIKRNLMSSPRKGYLLNVVAPNFSSLGAMDPSTQTYSVLEI